MQIWIHFFSAFSHLITFYQLSRIKFRLLRLWYLRLSIIVSLQSHPLAFPVSQVIPTPRVFARSLSLLPSHSSYPPSPTSLPPYRLFYIFMLLFMQLSALKDCLSFQALRSSGSFLSSSHFQMLAYIFHWNYLFWRAFFSSRRHQKFALV